MPYSPSIDTRLQPGGCPAVVFAYPRRAAPRRAGGRGLALFHFDDGLPFLS